ncbi:MAG TPA: DUF3418 domain-containing protein, partial [Rubrivivax sp.]|nr:DUF3418 domain-containing protein [Rubrivivax sp.]
NFGLVDPRAAREIFIREALVGHEWETRLPFLAANRKLIAQVEELEHKSRRQDVLVDDELIYAYYDQQLPADVHSGHSFERWYRDASKVQPRLLWLTRDELMRHEAAGITTASFPRVLRLGGVDCTASYLHDPGDAKDGVTVNVPIFALNQVSDERCEWLVPGMLRDKVLALVKSLHQRPRSRLVPLPDYAEGFVARIEQAQAFGQGSLMEALLKDVREKTQVDVKRGDFKLESLQPHLFMNFCIVDEHGRQLATGRNLAALKAELGGQARSSFQALARLKLEEVMPAGAERPAAPVSTSPGARGAANRPAPTAGAAVHGAAAKRVAAPVASAAPTEAASYTDWTFGELPELMEVRRGQQSLVGFPALIDKLDRVEIEVFDEPEVAAAKHRAGLRRLVSLQVRDAIKYLEKNLPDLQKMSVLYMSLGTADELRAQVIDLALDRAFLTDPLPSNPVDFKRCIDEGRGRLTLVANEVSRAALSVLIEYAGAVRKLKDARAPKELADDIQAQLSRLMPKRFVTATPWSQWPHLARYLKAVVLR